MNQPNRDMCRIMSTVHPGYDRRVQSDNYSTGACKYQEGRTDGSWEPDRIVAEDYFLTLRDEGWPVKLAGTLATRLWNAMCEHPDADQLTLVTLENGNRFALPTATLDLTTGWTSGAPLRDALVFDVRNRRARIRRVIEAYEPESERENVAA